VAGRLGKPVFVRLQNVVAKSLANENRAGIFTCPQKQNLDNVLRRYYNTLKRG
jgi:hypothetical protein